jgi:hypothetical protein
MPKFYGYRHTTARYRPGYRHLEEREFIGVFHELKVGANRYTSSEEYGDADDLERVIRIKAPRGVSFEQIREVVRARYTGGCRCEHDCCGHYQSGVDRITHSKRREWLVHISAYRNL